MPRHRHIYFAKNSQCEFKFLDNKWLKTETMAHQEYSSAKGQPAGLQTVLDKPAPDIHGSTNKRTNGAPLFKNIYVLSCNPDNNEVMN